MMSVSILSRRLGHHFTYLINIYRLYLTTRLGNVDIITINFQFFVLGIWMAYDFEEVMISLYFIHTYLEQEHEMLF